MYLFFSSDIHALYKKDILSAISLPEDYCLHFRYPINLVPNNIFTNLIDLKEKEGIIVYVNGNDHARSLPAREVSFLPIRNVWVKNVYYERTTDLVHVYLKLASFIKITTLPTQVLPNTNLDLPPHKFIYDAGNVPSALIDWHEKVKELVAFDADFNDHLFYKINVTHSEKSYPEQAQISFNAIENSSYFELVEDKNYILDLAIFNSAVDTTKYEEYSVRLLYPTEYFFITNPESINIGASADNRKYQVITKDTSSLSSSAYLKVQSFKKDASSNDVLIYDELVRLRIQRSTKKLGNFVVFTFLAAIGTGLLSYGSGILAGDKPDNGSSFGFIFSGLILILIAAAGNFFYFNKRS